MRDRIVERLNAVQITLIDLVLSAGPVAFRRPKKQPHHRDWSIQDTLTWQTLLCTKCFKLPTKLGVDQRKIDEPRI